MKKKKKLSDKSNSEFQGVSLSFRLTNANKHRLVGLSRCGDCGPRVAQLGRFRSKESTKVAMVHKKSTYRLNYRNYAPHVRKTVWQENNDIRLRRREEERSHHSIEESDSDCVCDESEEQEVEALAPRGLGVVRVSGSRDKFTDSQELNHHPAIQPNRPTDPPPNVPRLRFSPEHSPRISDQQRTPDSTDEGIGREERSTTGQKGNGRGNEGDDLHEAHVTDHNVATESRNRTRSSSMQLGVMRPGGQAREYDLIPAEREEQDGASRKEILPGTRISKSWRFPLTSQLSRTTRRNYHNRNRITYLPCGTSSSVRHIGDKTSFNIHLNRDQVRQTALQASSYRNREIENLIKKQRKLSINDWREKKEPFQPVNHSSLWADGRHQIFSSRKHPREDHRRPTSGVENFSNYCKHCGGRK
ncbi:uncharacterized protein LOC123514585 [Portunus trituberculatus]|uniref:uncharacterized protein LOC123514585 n=1 Tax=Portunus trituberculatus TaxID=210409 RepID=UPI001E1CE0D5|nr:uncharacterized protein LOC123514585 [Portunus trituberculatus]